jgi:hypothetical protein
MFISIRQKHAENRNKHKKKKNCTKLVLLTKLYKDALSTIYKISAYVQRKSPLGMGIIYRDIVLKYRLKLSTCNLVTIGEISFSLHFVKSDRDSQFRIGLFYSSVFYSGSRQSPNGVP